MSPHRCRSSVDATDAFLWSIIEVNSGLICACVPILKPFFRQIVPKSVTDQSWPLGKCRFSLTRDVLKDEEQYTHRWIIETKHGNGRSENSLTRSLTGPSTPESASNGTGALGSENDITPHPILHDRYMTRLPIDGDHHV